jgi:hypothetical protein
MAAIIAPMAKSASNRVIHHGQPQKVGQLEHSLSQQVSLRVATFTLTLRTSVSTSLSQ